MRYRFYRIHKYVCFELAEFDHAVATTDFADANACDKLKEKFANLTGMLKHHAEYEDMHIHEFLRQKSSHLQNTLEKEHQEHEKAFHDLAEQLEKIVVAQTHSQKIILGNDFYLAYRLFYSEMLKHLYDEERILLPELQALYSDAELAKLQAKTYQKMTPEQMLGMLHVFFPHANPEDMMFFTNEMKAAEPEKFKFVWEQLPDKYKKLIHNDS